MKSEILRFLVFAVFSLSFQLCLGTTETCVPRFTYIAHGGQCNSPQLQRIHNEGFVSVSNMVRICQAACTTSPSCISYSVEKYQDLPHCLLCGGSSAPNSIGANDINSIIKTLIVGDGENWFFTPPFYTKYRSINKTTTVSKDFGKSKQNCTCQSPCTKNEQTAPNICNTPIGCGFSSIENFNSSSSTSASTTDKKEDTVVSNSGSIDSTKNKSLIAQTSDATPDTPQLTDTSSPTVSATDPSSSSTVTTSTDSISSPPISTSADSPSLSNVSVAVEANGDTQAALNEIRIFSSFKKNENMGDTASFWVDECSATPPTSTSFLGVNIRSGNGKKSKWNKMIASHSLHSDFQLPFSQLKVRTIDNSICGDDEYCGIELVPENENKCSNISTSAFKMYIDFYNGSEDSQVTDTSVIEGCNLALSQAINEQRTLQNLECVTIIKREDKGFECYVHPKLSNKNSAFLFSTPESDVAMKKDNAKEKINKNSSVFVGAINKPICDY